MNTNKTPCTVEQAVQFTGFKRSYIYQLISQGKIPSYKPNPAKNARVFLAKEDLQEFIFSSRRATTAELHEQAESILNGGAV